MTCNRWKPMDRKIHYLRLLPSNSFQVKGILCSSGTPSVQFLSIRPVIKKKHTEKCKYRRTEQSDDKCSLKFPKQWVHLHVAPHREEEYELDRIHYLIIFVERIELSDASAIFKKFDDTVKWLRITNKFEFRIFFFGVDPKMDPYKLALGVVDKNMSTDTFEIGFKKEIEKAYGMEDAVRYELKAAYEDLGNKNGKTALGDNGRKPTMLTISQVSGEGVVYKFKVATIGKGNLRAYVRKKN